METTRAQMERMAEQIRTSWERSLVGEETANEREERQKLARKWHALRKSLR